MKAKIKILFKNGVTRYYNLELDENETMESYCNSVEQCIIYGDKGTLDVIDPIDNMNTIIDLSEVITFGYSIINDTRNNYYEK